MKLPDDHTDRMVRTRWSLECLALGDAFGETFFHVTGSVRHAIESRAVPPGTWIYTDDTVMAISIVEILDRFASIDQDQLAMAFAERYMRDPARGYGMMAQRLLHGVATGENWRPLAATAFRGQGSMGNGGAMRAAPIGAYFKGEPERAAKEADLSGEVTHAHPEGRAGAIAVAVAASVIDPANGMAVFDAALAHTPPGDTRDVIERAAALPLTSDPRDAAAQLGSGDALISRDTAPFCLWCAARHPDDYAEAMWATVAGLGDRDTTCAIVGGIVASSVDTTTVPQEWLDAREPLSRME